VLTSRVASSTRVRCSNRGGAYEHNEEMRPDHGPAGTRPRKPVRTDLYMGPVLRCAAVTGWSNVRKALEKYQDVVVAIRDGYFSSVLCVQDETAAGMGIHFLNRALLGPAADPMRPQILLYEPVGDKLQLDGAEWFVPLATGVKEALQTQPGGPVPALQRQPEMSEGRVHSHSGARKERSASMSKTTASAVSYVPNS
jgi:hypothetical protein